MGNSSSSLALIAALRTLGETPDSSSSSAEVEGMHHRRRSLPLLDDHELWRSLFTSTFTIIDLETVMTSHYLRSLRLFQPDRLATLLYKCVTQLHAFAFEHGEDGASVAATVSANEATSSSKTSSKKRSQRRLSTQSVINALMILQHAMPVVFENAEDSLHLVQSAASSGSDQCSSPHPSAADFLRQLFVFNRTCRVAPSSAVAGSEHDAAAATIPPTHAHDGDTFPPLSFPSLLDVYSSSTANSSSNAVSSTPPADVVIPLGAVLVECLVRLCFVPNFTIADVVVPSTVAPPSAARSATAVVPELLWCQGISGRGHNADTTFTSSLPQWGPSSSLLHHLNDAFISSTSDYRRQVLLTLNACLSLPLHRTRCVEEEPIFLSPLTRCVALFPTLVASLINNLVLYDPRGRLPYSSHMITTAEHVVVLGVQLLNISLDYSGLLLGPVVAAPTIERAERRGHHAQVDDHSDAAVLSDQSLHPRSRLSAIRRASDQHHASLTIDADSLNGRESNVNDDDGDGDASSSLPATVSIPIGSPTEPATQTTGPPGGEHHLPVDNGDTPQDTANSDKLFLRQTELSASAANILKKKKLSGSTSSHTPEPTDGENALCRNNGWKLLCQQMSSEEAQWVVNGLAVLFSNVTQSKSTYLPQSQRIIFEHDLLLVLLWKLVDRSAPIRAAFGVASSSSNGASPPAVGYVLPLCYYLAAARTTGAAAAGSQHSSATAKQKVERSSLPQIAMFTLLKLSSERSFVLACNEAFADFLPFPLPDVASPNGTYNDIIALTCLSVLQDAEMAASKVGSGTTTGKHRPLHASCVTVLANMAPFMQSVSLGTTQKLLRMLELFGRPSFLLEAPVEHGKWLMLLVEAICSLLQYQYRGCGHLAAALVRSKDLVYEVLDVFPSDSDPLSSTNNNPSQHGAAPNGSPTLSLSDLCDPNDANRDAVIEQRKVLLFTLRCAVGALEAVVMPLVQSLRVGAADIPIIVSQKTTLVGAIPVPHSIVVRAFPSTYAVDEWVSKALWGFIFAHAIPGTLVRSNKVVKLFTFV